MAYYYKYKFVSPDPLYARVKEELKSYFDTDMVDDLMFPIWTTKCLQKLGRSSLPIEPALLFVDNFEAKLPPDFVAVRECWMTACITPLEFRKPGAFYQNITTVLNKPFNVCDPALNCDPCNPDIQTVVMKTTTNVVLPIHLKFLLKPGNITVKNEHCHHADQFGCLNFSSSAADTFDIRDGKLITNFRQADVFVIYYASHADDSGYQLIPDNYRVQEFIEAFIKQKLFEQIFNQISDESFAQTEQKYELYKQMADEAFIMANIEIKKKTAYERAYGIWRDQHRNDRYILDRYAYRWRNRGWPASSWGLND